jgi:tetratricopeptide (TPR) repeat protein
MLRRIAVALVTAGVLGVPALAQDLAAGWTALDYGDDAAARGEFASRAAEASLWQAAASRGDARKAAAERALAAAPEAAGWLAAAARGLISEAGGERAAAVASLREAAAAAPRDARLWKLLGDALRAADDLPGANEAYQRAVQLQPVFPAANVALGDLARERGDFGAAFNAFNHAVDENDRPLGALIGRATARLYMGDSEGALDDLRRAAAVAPPGPDRGRALLGQFFVHAYLRQLPRGLEQAEQAVRMWQELARAEQVAAACNAIGRVLLETGDAAAAAGWYDRGWQAIEGSSLAPPARTLWRVRHLHGLARSAAARRDLERAQTLAGEAAALMASDAANAEHYAWIGPYLNGYLRLAERRNEEAVTELRSSDLERPYIRYLLAEAYSRLRDRAAAREWYQKALEASTGLEPESVLVRPLATAWLAKNR